MAQILDRDVNLAFQLGHHLHCLVAQLPIRVKRAGQGYEIADREAQWQAVRSVLYGSNIRKIIDHANQLFFTTRQTLDTLFVIQTNPKPEHDAYRDVLAGFYGEYLEDTPGVRETVTVFGNASDESVIDGYTGASGFGASSVVMGRHHKLARMERPEFSTDDFGGAPVCRLRFGTGTRLFYFNLPLHHELDPRTSRIPMKVHRIMEPAPGGGWARVSGERLPPGELVLP
jgi:hypothetical protein